MKQRHFYSEEIFRLLAFFKNNFINLLQSLYSAIVIDSQETFDDAFDLCTKSIPVSTFILISNQKKDMIH